MRSKSIVILVLIIVLIFGTAYVAVNGLTIGDFHIGSVSESMNLGLDIKGGVVIEYQAMTDATGEELASLMQQSKEILSRRINSLGLTEPSITIVGEDRIRIELPGVDNAQEAINLIGQTAKLEFALVTGDTPAVTGMPADSIESEMILTGENVTDASLTYDQYGSPAVGLEFDAEGTQKFSQASLEAISNTTGRGQIAIILDGTIISAPYVSTQLTDNSVQITGNFTVESAQNLALLIRGGALPVELEEVRTSVVGPTLGLEALNSALNAAIVGFILVVLFMILVYRLPGAIASVALVLYTCIVSFVMVGMDATLTLPGIAGIVLSLGMAVDANVIIFERLREELNLGKTLRSSLESGFHKAMRTILDANVTTFIAAIVLYSFGEGPIKGFAITLMIGIVTSMLTSIVVTRFMLVQSSNIFENKKLYGAKAAKGGAE